MWPPEVRGDLRAGLKAKNKGDLALSELYLQRAWLTAQTLPIDLFAARPYLKTSGVAIALAAVLEENSQPEKAYEVYSTLIAQLQDLGKRGKLSGEERMRAVAVASKLGEMAETYQLAEEEEETWLVWAVEELLMVVQDKSPAAVDVPDSEAGSKSRRLVLSELELPSWVSKTDLGPPIEALGAFYARVGKVQYAMPLYLQAMSILIPPPSQKHSSPEDRCRGAQLMNNLSELIMRGTPTPDKIHQAEAWARQAEGIIQKTKESTKGDSDRAKICEYALAAVLFNLGSLREMAEDRSASRELFTAALEQSKAVGMKEGTVEAQAALRRLQRLDRVASPRHDL
jgi:hypothetical protein